MTYVVTITWSDGRTEQHETSRAQAYALADFTLQRFRTAKVTVELAYKPRSDAK